MATFEQVLEKNRRIGPGFDFLRVFLAICIVGVHACLLTGHRNDLVNSPAWFVEYALVPMFFALSGFLITGSAIRLSLKNFLINRGLRIVPALSIDVIICALIIGPVITTLPLDAYFSDTRFHSYFLNVIGYMHYLLPGVFENNPDPFVNGALWTVPYEIFCYVIAAFFIVAKWFADQVKVAVFTFALLLAGAAVTLSGIDTGLHGSSKILLDGLLLSNKAKIVEAFLLGIVAYQWREHIKYSWPLCYACAALCVAAAFLPAIAEVNAMRLLLLPALTYITVFIGLTEVPIPAYFKKGDYSYGIYLYHDPLMQLVIYKLPLIALAGFAGAAFTFVCGLALVLLMSNLSWHFIEKPILGMRKKFSFVARVRELT